VKFFLKPASLRQDVWHGENKYEQCSRFFHRKFIDAYIDEYGYQIQTDEYFYEKILIYFFIKMFIVDKIKEYFKA